MKTIAIVYHSKFHTLDLITTKIVEGIKKNGEFNIHVIPVSEIPAKIEILNNADAIIFGSPTYFGAVSAEMKTFMDSTTSIWFKRLWKDKIAAGFTHSNSLSGDKFNTILQLFTFAMQHGMIWVGMDLLPNEEITVDNQVEHLNRIGGWSGLMCQSTPGSSLSNSDILTAIHFGERIAKTILKVK
jgi:multimeric flavodoxin WrbA